MKQIEAFRLGRTKEVSEAAKRKLIRTYGSAERAFAAPDPEIRRLLPRQGEAFLKSRDGKYDRERLYREWDELAQNGILYIPMEDHAYPEKLKEIPDCPYGLYVSGNLPVFTHSVAVVGSRRTSPYGKEMAARLGKVLGDRKIHLVSGMARGVDSLSQKACVEAGGITTAVLGCGVNVCYPPELKYLFQRIREQGCLLSEYPPDEAPRSYYFPGRNRIIAGLVDTVVVVEAAMKSGSLITADMANEQGRDVYAFPGRVGDPFSEGCNRLIQQGAGIVTSVEDLMLQLTGEEMNNTEYEKMTREAALTQDLKRVMDGLDIYPRSVWDVQQKTEIPYNQLLHFLTELEVKGLVRQMGAGFYYKK